MRSERDEGRIVLKREVYQMVGSDGGLENADPEFILAAAAPIVPLRAGSIRGLSLSPRYRFA